MLHFCGVCRVSPIKWYNEKKEKEREKEAKKGPKKLDRRVVAVGYPTRPNPATAAVPHQGRTPTGTALAFTDLPIFR